MVMRHAASNILTTSSASVTLAIGTNPSSGTLSGTKTVAAVNGVATFSNLSIDKVGTGYDRKSTRLNSSHLGSSYAVFCAETATKLAFSVQPSNTAVGHTLTPPPPRATRFPYTTLFRSSSASVTLAIGTNPSSGTLSGTKTVAAVNGVATFSNLSIDKVGTG